MPGVVKALVGRLLSRAEQAFASGYQDIADYTHASHREKLAFLIRRLLLLDRFRPTTPTINFLVTSTSEIRVFTPLIRAIIDGGRLRANIVAVHPHRFASGLENAIRLCRRVRMTRSPDPIIRSCTQPGNQVNAICLDHELHRKHHRAGIEIVRLINRKGGKTVCLQHGGTRRDNVDGHKSSQSRFQIVWGAYLYRSLVQDAGIDANKVYLTGNPLHDELHRLDEAAIRRKLREFAAGMGVPVAGKRLIVLATCLHSEYEDRPRPQELYRQYIRKVYQSMDYENCCLVVKMHAADSLQPNVYREQLNPAHGRKVIILPPDSDHFSFYELATVADLVVTRASTVAEEALLAGKRVLAFDLFADGPSRQLDFLRRAKGFSICAGMEVDLAAKILAMSGPAQRGLVSPQFVRDVTFELDGNSTSRVLTVLEEIARR